MIRVPLWRRAGRGRLAVGAAVVVMAVLLPLPFDPLATATPRPPSVTIAGSMQSELGCTGDWQPECAATHLSYDPNDDVWQGTWTVPAGNWEYKAALNDSWDENYGLHAIPFGPNIPLDLTGATSITFYYDHKTHWVTDDHNSPIVTAPGNYQSALGCSRNWDPTCLRSWLEDPDGDGDFTFSTIALPHGTYRAEVAPGGSSGPPITFTVPFDGADVVFRYQASSGHLSISTVHRQNRYVEYRGLGFDSRSTLYRTPTGAVPAGTPVTLRFRTYHSDVTVVRVRVYDTNTSTQEFIKMTRVATGVSCYERALRLDRCDFWQTTLPNPSPDVIWYRFIVSDGPATAFYADDTTALDGGRGVATPFEIDDSFALSVYEPGFTTPAWVKDAVIYQVFPDRFRNGDKTNDPPPGTTFYDQKSVLLPWRAKPEGHCIHYDTPCSEQPMGRDFFGGDLTGIRDKLRFIHDAGFNAIYLNPIFWARSNHRYDTADYKRVDPYLGDVNDFRLLVREAHAMGMHLILDGVFNHVSSDGPIFDRYHHWDPTGACESTGSSHRDWFYFTPQQGPCDPGVGYRSWFGFDSLPVLRKSLPAVQDYFLTGGDSVARHWLRAGADGWRMDLMSDPSFPPGYWQTFRDIVKSTDPQAVIIGELWQKDTTLLRLLLGDAADTTMNYRLRDIVNGLLSPNAHWDPKGFPDSGHPLTPTQAAQRLLAIQEDYAPPASSSLMNLIDSHDTARALWVLTPGPDDPAAKEGNPAALANGKRRLRLASLLQYTIPGAPSVYYGDEVGLTGADDPDNRRTFPWPDAGGRPDTELLAYYQRLGRLRRSTTTLTDGDFRVLVADDASGVLVYGRKDSGGAAVVVLNRGDKAASVRVPVDGYLPDRTRLASAFGSVAGTTVSGGKAAITVPPLSGGVLVTGQIDLEPPPPPSGMSATCSSSVMTLQWSPVAGAAGYNVYRSPVSGGGYVRLNGSPTTRTSFGAMDPGCGAVGYYVVTAMGATGNESTPSSEASVMPATTNLWNTSFAAAPGPIR